jgi:UDP-N-acetylmuramyl tripeptide synthase
MSSTDAIAVADAVVEEGDWTGPGAARKVLRHGDVTTAVLETARGGILRRGLAYERADAALVTNIGEDHFGDFGITALDDMARIKAVVWSGVRPGGKRIANAGCPVSLGFLARERPDAVGGEDWVLFGRGEPELTRHVERGGEAWRVIDGRLVHQRAGGADEILRVDEIPATFDGAAAHNVDNAMAAAAMASALGASHDQIGLGLRAFGRRPEDNPGRLELHRVADRLVLLDFGHNAHGVGSLAVRRGGGSRARRLFSRAAAEAVR